jgi:hypothetical protein
MAGECARILDRVLTTSAEPKKQLSTTEGTTIDVDALWASMKAAPLKGAAPLVLPSSEAAEAVAAAAAAEDEPEMIVIKREYRFAGQVHSESKLVPRRSAEAKLYLAGRPEEAKGGAAVEEASERRAPLRRPVARRSLFEPATDGGAVRTDLRFQTARYVAPTAASTAASQARRLNMVQKSALDWAGFVDREGIAEDLQRAGKQKGAYLDDQDFLQRADVRRDEEGRAARLRLAA